MTETIANSKKSFEILSKMVQSGLYKGRIEKDGFELKRNRFPNNYKVVGFCKGDRGIQVHSSLEQSTESAGKLAIALCAIVSAFFLLKQNWLVFLIVGATGMISWLIIRNQSQSELNLFMDKYREFSNMKND